MGKWTLEDRERRLSATLRLIPLYEKERMDDTKEYSKLNYMVKKREKNKKEKVENMFTAKIILS